MKEHSLKRCMILKKRDEVSLVIRTGMTFRKGCIKLILLPRSSGEYCKVAFLVSKKLGKKAVLRNKIKRWMREIFRTNKKYFPKNIWMVFSINEKYSNVSYQTALSDFMELVNSEELSGHTDKILSEMHLTCKKV